MLTHTDGHHHALKSVCTAFLWLQAYVQAFFARSLSGMPHMERQVHIVESPTYNIFSRTNSTIHVTFTYDATVRLQGACAGV
jgi:hypothetical protein